MLYPLLFATRRNVLWKGPTRLTDM